MKMFLWALLGAIGLPLLVIVAGEVVMRMVEVFLPSQAYGVGMLLGWFALLLLPAAFIAGLTVGPLATQTASNIAEFKRNAQLNNR